MIKRGINMDTVLKYLCKKEKKECCVKQTLVPLQKLVCKKVSACDRCVLSSSSPLRSWSCCEKSMASPGKAQEQITAPNKQTKQNHRPQQKQNTTLTLRNASCCERRLASRDLFGPSRRNGLGSPEEGPGYQLMSTVQRSARKAL